jgi:hypothetical protein
MPKHELGPTELAEAFAVLARRIQSGESRQLMLRWSDDAGQHARTFDLDLPSDREAALLILARTLGQLH